MQINRPLFIFSLLFLLASFPIMAQEQDSRVEEQELEYDGQGFLTDDISLEMSASPNFISLSEDFELSSFDIPFEMSFVKNFRRLPQDALTDALDLGTALRALDYSIGGRIDFNLSGSDDVERWSLQPSAFISYYLEDHRFTGIFGLGLNGDEYSDDAFIDGYSTLGYQYRIIFDPESNSGLVLYLGGSATVGLSTQLASEVIVFRPAGGPELELRSYFSPASYMFFRGSTRFSASYDNSSGSFEYQNPSLVRFTNLVMGLSFSLDWQKKYRYVAQ